jgi:hypothetical protein
MDDIEIELICNIHLLIYKIPACAGIFLRLRTLHATARKPASGGQAPAKHFLIHLTDASSLRNKKGCPIWTASQTNYYFNT